MTDVHDIATRSYNMSRIKGRDTKPEMMVRKFLFSQGFRYRLHVKNLPGRPDIVLPRFKTVIFVNGCFWHGHINCTRSALPRTRTDWWKNKIERNKINDNKNYLALIKLGYKVIIVWQCEIRNENRKLDLLNEFMKYTNKSGSTIVIN